MAARCIYEKPQGNGRQAGNERRHRNSGGQGVQSYQHAGLVVRTGHLRGGSRRYRQTCRDVKTMYEQINDTPATVCSLEIALILIVPNFYVCTFVYLFTCFREINKEILLFCAAKIALIKYTPEIASRVVYACDFCISKILKK